MNKLFVLLFSLLILSACNQNTTSNGEELPMDTDLDSMSYALGVNIGKSLQIQELDSVDLDLFFQGIVDFQDNKSRIQIIEAGDIVNGYVQKIERNRNESVASTSEQWMKDNLASGEFTVTSSGLQYKIIEQGNENTPDFNDKVEVHYEGFLTNGQKIDSSRDRGTTSSWALTSVMKGWQEGLQLIGEGGKINLVVPYSLAYGPTAGPGNAIPPYSNLMFEIEVFKVIHVE